MKIIIILAALVFSTFAFATDSTEPTNKMKCAFDAETLESFKGINDDYPFGLWKMKTDDSSLEFRVYLNHKESTIGLFRTLDSLLGVHSVNTTIGICKYAKRFFITEEGEYFEFYRDGKKLKIATEEFDEEFPEARSEFEFYSASPAKVVKK